MTKRKEQAMGDELVGVELAAAVAAEVGLVYVAGMWWTEDEDGVQHSTGMGEWSTEDYRPDLNIAQAWELDGAGWAWEFRERPAYLLARVYLEDPWTERQTLVTWSDFPTKAQAYAAARCRAYLKAKAAE